jgi:L-serine dehydratase
MTDERLSIVDMFKIGVGPSSSHTLGPWRAAQQCLARWSTSPGLDGLRAIEVHLYGSLAKTGRGHGTDVAVIAGLLGADPEVCDMTDVHARAQRALTEQAICLPTGARVGLQVNFHLRESLPAHPNGLRFEGRWDDDGHDVLTCFSIGGGFVVWESDEGKAKSNVTLPFPIDRAEDLLRWCGETGLSV